MEVPPNLRSISITMPKERFTVATYDQFEASLEHLSQALPNLELIRVRASHGHLLPFNHEDDIRLKLRLRGVKLVSELVSRGKRMVVLPLFTLFFNWMIF